MTDHTISLSRCALIMEHFVGWSFGQPDDFQPDKRLFEQLDHPADLHYLADLYNWDDGALVLGWILDSEHCTRSTANLLFWRAAPDYYTKFDLADDSACPSYNEDGFYVIRKVLEKYRTGSFCPYQIEYDPAGDIEERIEENPKWEYPQGVYHRIEGVIVRPSIWIRLLASLGSFWMWLKYPKFRKRK